MIRPATTFALCACGASALTAQESLQARGSFIGANGAGRGEATLTQAPQGVLIRVELTGVPEGAHGFHIHETGVCEPPFESAGRHFSPAESAHGYLPAEGPHAGDLPNLHVPASGELTEEVFTSFVSLEPENAAALLDQDGAALVIHEGADDYRSQPSGDSGSRIACAVLSQ